MTEKKAPGETTQEVEALKRRIHERIGAWIADHWTELASGIGGAIAGAFAVYGLFASEVHDAGKAAADAKDASAKLNVTVGALQATVNQLVTQQQLKAAEMRIKELEDWKCYAQQYRSKQPQPGCDHYNPGAQ